MERVYSYNPGARTGHNAWLHRQHVVIKVTDPYSVTEYSSRIGSVRVSE